jgi:hypothetical protein
MPVFVEDVWSSGPPQVGKIVTIGMRIKSITNEENIVFILSFPETVATFNSPLHWEFGLKADQEKEIYTDLCVLETGAWVIDVSIASLYADGELKFGDLRAIGLISYPSEAKVLLEKDITYSQAVETERSNYEVVKVSVDECSR